MNQDENLILILYPDQYQLLTEIYGKDKSPYLARLMEVLKPETKTYIGEMDRRTYCLALLYLKDRYGSSELTKRMEDIGKLQDVAFMHCLDMHRQEYNRYFRL